MGIIVLACNIMPWILPYMLFDNPEEMIVFYIYIYKMAKYITNIVILVQDSIEYKHSNIYS